MLKEIDESPDHAGMLYTASPQQSQGIHPLLVHSPTVGTLLGHRRRRWPNIRPAMG